MYPLKSGSCVMLGLNSPCPSHLHFSSHVFLQFQFRPPSEAPHPPALSHAHMLSATPTCSQFHPPALSHTHLLSAPPTCFQSHLSGGVEERVSKQCDPWPSQDPRSWLGFHSHTLSLFIIDMARFSNLIVLSPRLGTNLQTGVSLDPRTIVMGSS